VGKYLPAKKRSTAHGEIDNSRAFLHSKFASMTVAESSDLGGGWTPNDHGRESDSSRLYPRVLNASKPVKWRGTKKFSVLSRTLEQLKLHSSFAHGYYNPRLTDFS
jgi:hypothetical protein